MTSSVGAALTPLIGRERELLDLEARLAGGARLITLLGPGGSGKTRLARGMLDALAAREVEAHFVDLVGTLDSRLVPAEIATELGVSETPSRDAAAAVTAALQGASTVLVLDNLEELTSARDFLAGLLLAAPGLQVVTTSRIPLGIAGEIEFQVPPLGLPEGDGSADVESSPAGRLFLDRARAVGRLDEDAASTSKAIAELCRRLDGLPLALELAAARTRILPPASILRHLKEQTAGLMVKAGGTGDRHRSLDAVLNWSLDLLEPNEADVLTAVAICPGGFDLDVAVALAPDRNVLEAIDVLASRGLLSKRGEVEGEPWFRLLETIRAAALHRASSKATSSGWRRLAIHMANRVEGTQEAFYKIDDGAFRRLDALLDDIRAVLDWAEVNDPALSLSIVGKFYDYWRMRGRSREGIPRLRAAIAANPYPSSDLARALTGLAELERNIGGPPEVLRAATRAAKIARTVGDRDLEVLALNEMVPVLDESNRDVSTRLHELLPTLKHPVSRFWCLNALAFDDGRDSGFASDVMFRYYLDAEDALAGTPYHRFQFVVAGNLAQVYLYRDQVADAYRQSTRAVAALQDADPEIRAWVHSIRAIAAAAAGQVGEANASLRLAFEHRDFGALGLPPEAWVAAVAVLSASSSPLLAAKVWGGISGTTFGGPSTDMDRALAERLLITARKATDPVAFELAFKAGQRASSEEVIDDVLGFIGDVALPSGRASPARLPRGTLTKREIEVLTLVGAGKTDVDIAADLFISPKTASVHVSNAKAKLGLKTRLETALWAREQGLVE